MELNKELSTSQGEHRAAQAEIIELRGRLRELEEAFAARGSLGAVVEAQIAEIDRARDEANLAFEAAERAQTEVRESKKAQVRSRNAVPLPIQILTANSFC